MSFRLGIGRGFLSAARSVSVAHTAPSEATQRVAPISITARLAPDRAFLADTTALVVFFTATGVLNERFVAGMDWSEVALSRTIGAPLMMLTARPYGLWRDLVMRRAGAGRVSRTISDTMALLSFQVPIYAAIITAGGADGVQILRGTLGAAMLMLVLGRPYGVFLDWVRARFGLPPGGTKPMSPDPDA